MKFSELLECFITDENLILDVQNDQDYGTFSGSVMEFRKDEPFQDLEVMDIRTVIVNDVTDSRINDNVFSVKTEIWVSLYDPEWKVLEPQDDDDE